MVINPNELFEEITIYGEASPNREKCILAFPALDIEDSGHGLQEFAGDQVNKWNHEWGRFCEVIHVEKFAQVEMRINPEMESECDKEWMSPENIASILHLDVTSEYGNICDADYTLGLYRFVIDVGHLRLLGKSEEEIESILSKVSDFISVLIIMSVQIAGVITKYKIDSNFYYDHFAEKANPIMITLELAFNGELTPIYSGQNPDAEFRYINISEKIDYMLNNHSNNTWLLSYFPLYVANYNRDILSDKEMGMEQKQEKEEPVGVIGLVNFIIDQEE